MPCQRLTRYRFAEHLADDQGKLLCLITVSGTQLPRGPIYRGRRGLP